MTQNTDTEQPKKQTRYIFITGGVVSSLGKGIVSASLGVLLKEQGFNVTIQKFDPYLNVDPGTMSPYQHGEVFVTEDGCETDLDLGHYERFIDQNLSQLNNTTSGMIFWDVLNKERKGDYLGNTVQIIPHVTNEIKHRISQCLKESDFDFVITEVGGTVGDIESLPFLEAIRQFQFENRDACIHMHLTLVPFLKASGEFKTKPTQHSVKELRQIGIHSDIIICRTEHPFPKSTKEKIALFCDVQTESVITACNAESIYEVPLLLEEEQLDAVILNKLGLKKQLKPLQKWKDYIQRLRAPKNNEVTIAIVGKYTSLTDAYISIVESLKHASCDHHCQCTIKWINSEKLSPENLNDSFEGVSAILIPGGFGDRGIEGKVLAANYARRNKIPYLGLCLGMHIAIIEIGRNVIGLPDANSTEFNPKTSAPVIDFLPNQKTMAKKGGTMRLGAYECHISKGTRLHHIYQETSIEERHRHRYEFNNDYRDAFESNDVIFSGTSPDNQLIEVMELQNHPFYVACQFHPEFKSRPLKSHPLFNAFIQASMTAKPKASSSSKEASPPSTTTE